MITIRPAKPDEVKKLQDLANELFLDNHQYDPDIDVAWATSEKGKIYFTKLLNDPDVCCLIAEDNDQAVGYLLALPADFVYCKSRYIEVEHLGVNPAYRSKRIGAMLIKKYLEWAKAHGYQKGYVSAYFANNRGIAFYKHNGFSAMDLSLEIDL